MLQLNSEIIGYPFFINNFAAHRVFATLTPIQHLQQSGQEISEADLERLSPVRYEHINVFGKYSFDSPSVLTDDGLRPLVVKE